MALNPTPVGDAIATLIQSMAPAPGAPVTSSQLKSMWEGIVGIIYSDLQASLGVSPGTFQVTVPPGGGTVPVTGIGGPAL